MTTHEKIASLLNGIPFLDTPELFWISGCPNSRKIQIVLNEKDVRYVSRMMSYELGDHRMSSFLELNPRGQVPVLKYRDFALTEHVSIMLYLEEAFPQNPLLPRNPTYRAQCISKTLETNYLSVAISNFTPFICGQKNKEEHIMEFYTLYSIFARELTRWNDVLHDQFYIMGDIFTIADVSLICLLDLAVRMGMDFNAGTGLEHLARYYGSVSTRQSILDTIPTHWKQTPNGQLLVFAQKFFTN
eukprot:TRINITY_DN7621_c0_g1_i1.p1 TRINITY_DN7621_c0_g1~~TRINITY_DN7621_c0_g1_i1.p1  ORF type:complete len:244 (-),score=32.91 TRINITY_DN7621_c0_g1_i1:54-785(-)